MRSHCQTMSKGRANWKLLFALLLDKVCLTFWLEGQHKKPVWPICLSCVCVVVLLIIWDITLSLQTLKEKNIFLFGQKRSQESKPLSPSPFTLHATYCSKTFTGWKGLCVWLDYWDTNWPKWKKNIYNCSFYNFYVWVSHIGSSGKGWSGIFSDKIHFGGCSSKIFWLGTWKLQFPHIHEMHHKILQHPWVTEKNS